jgi:prepilin-type N-terminal cleavage/methylation domain-containing protein/prepilin-type processing-associated H-X9-DG protein
MTPPRTPRNGLSLVEMLVVIGLIGLLAGIVTVAVVTARRFSLRVACQENMRQIGQTLHQMALSGGGAYPRLEDDQMIPWWANVYRQWEGAAPIDTNSATDNLQLPEQLPAGMKSFKCPMGNPLDISSADNLRRSISYGINFDVAYYAGSDPAHAACASSVAKLQGKPYTAALVAATTPCVHDKYADDYFFSQLRNPSNFILLAEANAGIKDVTGDEVPDWTGGRVASDVIVRNNADVPPGRCPIVPRHGDMANILYADIHVELQRASPLMIGGDVNMVLTNWTLTGE